MGRYTILTIPLMVNPCWSSLELCTPRYSTGKAKTSECKFDRRLEVILICRKEFVKGDVYLRDMKNTKYVSNVYLRATLMYKGPHRRNQSRIIPSHGSSPILDLLKRLDFTYMGYSQSREAKGSDRRQVKGAWSQDQGDFMRMES